MQNDSNNQLTRRPATGDDLELIYSIVRSTMRLYVEQTWGTWDETAQRKRFDEATRAEDHSIIEFRGAIVGCMCLRQLETEFCLNRLFILPEFQNRGLGTQILRELLLRADEIGLPIRLRVLRVNPARRLYERHGFKVVEETETHLTMIRQA